MLQYHKIWVDDVTSQKSPVLEEFRLLQNIMGDGLTIDLNGEEGWLLKKSKTYLARFQYSYQIKFTLTKDYIFNKCINYAYPNIRSMFFLTTEIGNLERSTPLILRTTWNGGLHKKLSI